MTWRDWEGYDPARRSTAPPAADARPTRPHKYHAEPTEVDGHLFPSRHEAQRYQDLVQLQQAGEIEDLRLQMRFPLVVEKVTLGHYVADFTYWQKGRLVVEDAKGVRTEIYRWKRRHFAAQYGQEIREV